jgi:catechol 2,3-dioxygenase-like lactoylglutathione lyase family enzyme
MARIKAIEARLHVGDLRRSLAFYTETLGFRADALIPENAPEFAILSRDGIGLQLVRSPAPTMGRAKDAGCTLWVDVEDVRRLHEAIRTRAVVEWGPEVYAYGRREFAFRDPDGHLVVLSEETDDPVTCTTL